MTNIQQLLEEKNAELEKELTAKNRELEIESSLERVRTVAMSMNKPDDMLDVCKTISKQLELLNVKKIRNVQTAIFYKEKGTYVNYEYYAKHNKTFITETSYTNNKIHQEFAEKMLKGNGEFMVAHIKGHEVKDWIAYQKTTNVFIDNYLYTASSINYYWFSLGPVALGISTYEPLKEEDINLFKRFLKVFELAYRRYLDIEQAEAQAREAKIEAALEKVRSRSLAVHKSDEFNEVIKVVFERLQELEIPMTSASINIVIDGSKDTESYICGFGEGGLTLSHIRLIYFNHPIANDRYNAYEKGLEFFTKTYNKEEKNSFFKYEFEVSDLKHIPADIKKIVMESERYTISMALTKNSMIVINDFEGKTLSPKEIDIVKRFSKVFEQAYIRFLDLQKAEAQAREAQIEAALEKVRSRSLAMHTSKELQEVVTIIFDKLTDLNIKIDSASVIVLSDKADVVQFWVAVSGQQYSTYFEIPHFDNTKIARDFNKARESGKSFTKSYTGKEKNEQWNYLFEHSDLKNIPDDRQKALLEAKAYTVSVMFTKNIALQLLRNDEEVFSENENKIFQRFANVFEQAYIRFLDLQKAEAQSRESQIQLALERARAQSMMMQHSTELDDTLRVFHEQILQLNIPSAFSFLWLPDEDNDRHIFWAAWTENLPAGQAGNSIVFKSKAINYPLDRNEPATAQCLIDWKSNNPVVSYHVLPDGVTNYFAAWSELITGVEKLKPEYFSDGLYYVEAFMKYGCFGVMVKNILPEDEKKILSRFAVEFERAYTRFLDLQKAEAQSRESQIQLALERVRARTMAMQRSDELQEAASLMFQQIEFLGAPTWNCSFNIWTEDKKYAVAWNATKEGFGRPFYSPSAEDVFLEFYTAAQQGKELFIKEIGGQELEQHYQYLSAVPGVGETIAELKAAGIALPTFQIFNIAYFTQGYLMFITYKPVPELWDIFKRFAKVFEQTYTRFLDLQKAEAQAREAQIELGLERVRARAMAMQKSDELKEAGELLWNELGKLGIESLSSGYVLVDKDEKIGWTYAPNPATGKIAEPLGCFYTETKEMLAVLSGWKKQEPLTVIEMDEQETIAHQTFIAERAFNLDGTICKWITAKQLIALSPKRLFLHNFNFTQGYLMIVGGNKLTEEQIDLMLRFTKVFQQTYTRFLDLQKAEAQAREAQIEAALENVRSSSLAMHRSDQLKSVATVMFKKWMELGLNLTGAFIFLYDKETRNLQAWIATTALSQPVEINTPYSPDIAKNQIFKDEWSVFETGKEIFNRKYSGKMKNDFFRYVGAYNNYPQEVKDFQLKAESWIISIAGEKHCAVGFDSWNGQLATIEDYKILKRFARTFEQAYIRFLDLQKAEAQAREAQIELGLERVRARAMAMQTSEELNPLIGTVFTELTKLDILLTRCVILIYEGNEKGVRWWMANSETPSTPMNSFVKYADMPFFNEYLKGWYNRELKWQYCLEDENKIKTDGFLFNETELSLLPDFVIEGMKAPNRVYLNASFNNFGNLTLATLEPLSEEHFNILLRFAKVFDLTYTRFNDLKQAEAQARESQIQLALERVRARTMAMQTSDELAEVSELLFKQVGDLGIKTWATGFNIWSDDNNSYEDWITSPRGGIIEPYTVDATRFPTFIELSNARKSNVEFYVQYSEGEMLKQTYEELLKFGNKQQFELLPEEEFQFPTKQYLHIVFGSKASLMFITYEPMPEAHDIFKRFGKVFEQTYTRFLDLQKAEAQAKEAQIELGLERVRARAMAMQTSEELNPLIGTVFTELTKLDILLTRCVILIYEGNEKGVRWWMANSETPSTPMNFFVKYADMPFFNEYFKGWYNRSLKWQCCLEGENKIKTDNFLFTETELSLLPDFVIAGMRAPDRVYLNASFNNFGNLTLATLEPLSEEHFNILLRFAKVFDLTYTRFNDLKKAEEQAREAKIEAALERVRSRSMGMQKSEDLKEVIQVVFEQFVYLNINVEHTGFIIDYKERDDMFIWLADKHAVPFQVTIPYFDSAHWNSFNEAKATGKDFFTNQLSFEEKNKFYQDLFKLFPVPDEAKEYYFSCPGLAISTVLLDNVGLYIENFSGVPYSNEENKTLMRFGKVFQQTYTRFNDLKQAEEQAREAKIEAALERVRSRTLAMQKSDELAETAAVLFKQLILLGIEPNRLYISIMKNDEGDTEFWITDEDGSKVSMAYEDNLNNNPSFKKMYDGWKQQKKSLMIDMKGKTLKDYFNYLSSIHVPFKSGLAQKRRLQYIAYFSKGFIGMASPDEQPAETLQLLERFAYVFNLTFTRFSDLQIAEAHAVQAEHDLIEIKEARKNAEETLAELQSTQKQLIQSEKMASLGELTAGIAHEIQNPLNFVNNFSEVSKELLDEMKAALESGDEDEVREIVKDVIQNLEKINHHGKRADAIVKGMLQHSRKSEGIKEPTDINALCDEYLRLSFHGLRAKDKSFNADFKTDFDENIRKINIVPQDTGRVLINLFNNAFYAVSEKQKTADENYKPLVTVATKSLSPLVEKGWVEVIISDNGNGIPQNVIDKIFQPFFTTKPTGQGTGLGLSLAYDIITKEHNGTIKVESKEGEGSTFVINLPVV